MIGCIGLAREVSMDTRCSSVPSHAVVYLLVTSAFTACAGATKPTAPDTEKQRKVRTDLEQCNAALTGNKAYLVAVTPEGKYSFEVIGPRNADTILECMRSKGYSGKRIDIQTVGYRDTLRTGGEGEPSQ
jgi:hypothetical protein